MNEKISKYPLPGYGIALIDESQDSADDNMGKGAQVGTLIVITEEDKSKKIADGHTVTFGDLLDKKIYWRAYAEADGRWYDKDLQGDVIFIQLDKIMGLER